MAKGPLRTAVESAAFQNFEPEGGPGWWARVRARWKEYNELMILVSHNNPLLGLYAGWSVGWLGPIYALTGAEFIIKPLRDRAKAPDPLDISKQIAQVMAGAFGNPVTAEIAESLGAIVTDGVVNLFEQYAGKDDKDPKEFARAFHGFMIGLNLSGGLADTLAETVSGGQIEGIGRTLQSVYWSLGLGFLGWQTLAPLLSSGLQPGLERYYNRLYRPSRFSAGDLRDLYALGEISLEGLKGEAQTLGWRDQDIEKWLRLAFRTLPQGDIFQAYKDGLMSQDEAASRLRALGYDPKDIPLLFQLNPKDDTGDAKNFTVSTAKQGYRDGIIPRAELVSILTELKYQPREIDVILAIEDAKKAQDNKSLTVTQIKSAWSENIIMDTEATHWLQESGFGPEEIGILLQTWKAELVPVFRKLNIGTITGAYVAGILTRAQASDKLQQIGLLQEDALLELDLTEARNPDAFGKVVPPPAKQLTPAALADLVSVNLISSSDMATRLVAIGYSERDANLLAEAARLRTIPKAKTLSQVTIERAYLAGVFNRATALENMLAAGFDQRAGNIILDTVEKENPDVFSSSPEDRNKQLTPGTMEDLVIAGLMTPDEMFSRLQALNYSQGDAEVLTTRAVQLATPAPRVLNADLVTRAYLFGVIDRVGALSRLTALDYSLEDANTILDTLERANPAVFNPGLIQSVRLPSIPVLVAALQNEIITVDEYFAKAQELGFRVDDARMYLTLATKNVRKSTKELSSSQVVNAYGAGLFSWGEALSRLTQQGYSDFDSTVLLKLEKQPVEDTDAWGQMLSGNISAFDAVSQLVSANYADKDIVDAFASLPADLLAGLGINITQLAEALGQIPGGQV